MGSCPLNRKTTNVAAVEVSIGTRMLAVFFPLWNSVAGCRSCCCSATYFKPWSLKHQLAPGIPSLGIWIRRERYRKPSYEYNCVHLIPKNCLSKWSCLITEKTEYTKLFLQSLELGLACGRGSGGVPFPTSGLRTYIITVTTFSVFYVAFVIHICKMFSNFSCWMRQKVSFMTLKPW